MTASSSTRRYYWDDFIDDEGAWRSADRQPPGEDLAAMRRGLGREAGTVPGMWPFYRTPLDDQGRRGDYVSDRLRAEHHALTLFAVHQQSRRDPVHRPGVDFGDAVRRLHAGRDDGSGSGQAIDRRFYAAVTSGTLDVLARHLRGLVQLLRTLDPPAAFDYTQLVDDLTRWASPSGRDRVRRRWGLQYHAVPSAGTDDPAEEDQPDSSSAEPASAG